MQLDQRVVATDGKHADLIPLLGQLAQTLGKQRMILAQEAANDQCGVEILDFGKLEAKPRRAGALAVSRKIAATRAEIDTTLTKTTRHFLQQM
jgi:hypothetical protein